MKTLEPADLAIALHDLRVDPGAPPELWHAVAAVAARLNALEASRSGPPEAP